MKRGKIFQRPQAKGKGTVSQADSVLKWWGIYHKEVPRSNKMLISDIREIKRLTSAVKVLEARSNLKSHEKDWLRQRKQMLRAALLDVAAELYKLEVAE